MLLRLAPETGNWVFSGSALKWATPIEPFYDLIVFLQLKPLVRMQRLRRREAVRYGARLEPGGDMAGASAAFLAWAEAYDTAGLEQRSRIAHETWLATQTAPVLRSTPRILSIPSSRLFSHRAAARRFPRLAAHGGDSNEGLLMRPPSARLRYVSSKSFALFTPSRSTIRTIGRGTP